MQAQCLLALVTYRFQQQMSALPGARQRYIFHKPRGHFDTCL